jgi:hypothetical protein
MRSDGKLADALRVVTYGTLGLAFLLFASNDRAPNWMPWLIGAVVFAGVGYCAWDWREARWKMILGLLPGVLAVFLVLTWYVIHSTAMSSIYITSRFSLQALQKGLTLRESTQSPSRSMIRELPEWSRDMWRLHFGSQGRLIPATSNTPGAFQYFSYMNNQRQFLWARTQSTYWISVPIWSPAAILGIPTLFWIGFILTAKTWKQLFR